MNRNGDRRRKVVKAKPQKNSRKQTPSWPTFAEKDGKLLAQANPNEKAQIKRLSIDCKATVDIGESARGGKTRGDHRAADHDLGGEEKYVPFAVVDEDSGRLHLTCHDQGHSSPPTMKASVMRGTIGMGDDGAEVAKRMVVFPRCLTRSPGPVRTPDCFASPACRTHGNEARAAVAQGSSGPNCHRLPSLQGNDGSFSWKRFMPFKR